MNRESAPRLDLFKLIVSLILVVILVLLLLRGCGTKTPAPDATKTPVSANPTETSTMLPAFTETSTAPPSTETLTPSPTLPSSTVTATIISSDTTSTIAPEATSTAAATEIATTATAGATPVSGDGSSCNTSVPSRLSVGQQARVILRLNMRSDPSIEAAILQTNPANTQVEIVGGPVCTPVGERAYLWWQIRLPDGAEGWSAESQLNQPSYFLEPIP